MRGANIDTKQRKPKIYSEISARLLRLKICHFCRARFRLVESSVGVIGVVFANGVACVRGVGLSSLKQVLLRELVRGVARDFVSLVFFISNVLNVFVAILSLGLILHNPAYFSHNFTMI